MLVPQVVAVQLFPAAAAIGAQVCTPVGPTVMVWQVVATKLLPAFATSAVQVCTGTLLVVTGAGQLVVV